MNREKEAIMEQEILLKEQQLAIKLLKQMKLKKDYQHQLRRVQETPKSTSSLSQLLTKAKSSTLLNPEDNKQVMEWMDLEKNSYLGSVHLVVEVNL